MNSFREVLRLLIKKPFIWIVPSFFMVPFCIFEYQVLYPLVHGISSVGMGDIYEVIFYFIQFSLAGFNTMIQTFPNNIVVLSIVVLTLFLLSLVFSGYLNVVNGCVNERKSGFISGFKIYFLRINAAFLAGFLAIGLFFFFAVIASIPALVLTRTFATAKAVDLDGNHANSVITSTSLFLVDSTTILVILFQLSLIVLYFSFWFASIYSFDKGSFKPAKRVVNRFFWNLVFEVMIFCIIFVIFEIIFSKSSIWLSIYFPIETIEIFFIVFINAIIKALLLGSYISYIFLQYKYKKRLLFG